MTERELQHHIRLVLGQQPDLVLWRNSAGVGTVGNGPHARKVRFGLAVGASDLIGILTLPSGVGRFVALELKTDRGALTPEQALFLRLVRSKGGCAGVARSVDEALRLLNLWRSGGDDAGCPA